MAIPGEDSREARPLSNSPSYALPHSADDSCDVSSQGSLSALSPNRISSVNNPSSFAPQPGATTSSSASSTSSSTSTAVDSSSKPWHLLPDSLLYELFRFLDAASLCRVSLVCTSWLRVSRDPFLWKYLFCRRWEVDPRTISSSSSYSSSSSSSSSFSSTVLPQLSPSERRGWREEYIRLHDRSPRVESEVHAGILTDEVLHVCFSPDGRFFSTSSKDTSVKVR